MLNVHHDDNDDDDVDDKDDYDHEEKACTEAHCLLLYLPMHYLTISVTGSEKQGCRCGERTSLPPNKMKKKLAVIKTVTKGLPYSCYFSRGFNFAIFAICKNSQN